MFAQGIQDIAAYPHANTWQSCLIVGDSCAEGHDFGKQVIIDHTHMKERAQEQVMKQGCPSQ